MIVGPPAHAVEDVVTRALAEDFGLAGDLTTAALIDPGTAGRATLGLRAPGVLAGTWTTEAVCAHFDLFVAWDADDGDQLEAGDVAGEVEGDLAALLQAERTILNLLTHLSGIATLTRRFVDACAGTDCRVRDTRKTLPGLRALEKAAVRAGGGVNHRMGLFDAMLVKDNHLVAAATITDAVERCRAAFPGVPLEIEADTVAQAVEAAEAGADLVLVDNMDPASVKAAVDAIAGRCPVEVSGGLSLDTVAEYAATGVAFVAVGALTHSAPALDIGLDLVSFDAE